MTPSDLRPEAAELLAKAQTAKSHPLSSEESRSLEAHLLDEFLVGAPKDVAAELRKAIELYGGVYAPELDPNAPEPEVVKVKRALFDAYMELRNKRVDAENRIKFPPFDSTGMTRVQIVFVETLRDSGAAAMIYRRPDDNGRPFVLVRADSLNALDLYRLVRFAARSVAGKGANVAEEQWSPVLRREIDEMPETVAPGGYDELVVSAPNAPLYTFPGLGEVRAFFAWIR